eukprot:gene25999-biopygen12765
MWTRDVKNDEHARAAATMGVQAGGHVLLHEAFARKPRESRNLRYVTLAFGTRKYPHEIVENWNFAKVFLRILLFAIFLSVLSRFLHPAFGDEARRFQAA